MFKRIIALLLIITALLSVVACSSPADSKKDDEITSQEMKVKFFKMGRASCTIIRTEDKVVMIDTGDEEKYPKIIEYLEGKEIKHIDTLIITSLSKRNIGGLSAVLGVATVGEIYLPDYTKSSGTYLTFKNAIENAGLTPKAVSETTNLEYGETKLTVHPAKADYTGAVDNEDEVKSLVIEVVHGNTEMLLTSKINGDRLTEVGEMFKDREFDLVWVPNYGEYDAKLEDLFGKIKTEYAVVVTSNTNPLPENTKAVLVACGIEEEKIFNTVNGAVEVKCNGAGIVEIKY